MQVNNIIREDLSKRELADLLSAIVRALNLGIEFGDAKNKKPVNLNLAFVTGVTPNPINTDFALTHNLGRIPTGWFPVWKDNYVDFKIGAGVWTSKQIFLQASVINVNYRIIVF